MFGSKNKQQKSQMEVNIETMEGNLKGEGGKTTTVEYNKINLTQDTNNGATPPPTSDTTQEPAVNSTDSKKTPFKSPFKGGDLPIAKSKSATGTIGQRTFPPSTDNSETNMPGSSLDENIKRTNSTPEIINPSKKDDSAFLHQAIDRETDNKGKTPNKQPEKIAVKKKKGMKSFLLIVLFIILLAGILFGGYYFYMNKEDDSSKVTPPVKPIESTTNKPNIPIKKPIQKEEVQTAPKIEKLVTSVETFNDDLSKFIQELKQRRNLTDLQNGIFISPMITATENPLLASDLLNALHMTTFFVPSDLRNSCKVFAVEDDGEMKLAVIFELVEMADEKLVKNNIIQNEKDLMAKMSYLFVDGIKPAVPTKINFAVNENNMKARYANYVSNIDTSSVDWSILDLGKGKLVYFATSRKTAKILTDYFMRTVIK